MKDFEFSVDQFQPRSQALRTLIERGYLNQATNLVGIDAAFQAGIVTAYVGFDATADSLHVGHLLPIMMLRRLQQAGHRPIVLIGGGTTRIGDPSFRSDARPMLSDAQIAANIDGIKTVFERLLTFGDGPTDAVIVNNADWLDGVRWIDMLREVGRHFSINRMLSFDSVKSRLGKQENLTFLEFNYMILQAFDFLELSRRFSCGLQMGGADQWGNIVSGIDLIRRLDRKEVFGLTAPLLTTASGAKMGKTAAGAVWLNADRLSPYEYWQFWRNTEDADVGRFLRLFTDLSTVEIGKLTENDGPGINSLKERLATEATALIHGIDAAKLAAATARQAFEGRGVPVGVPTLELNSAERGHGVLLLELLVRTGLTSSKGEGRRMILGRGIKLNHTVVEDVDLIVQPTSLPVTLSVGRRRHAVVR
ncbi:MULTISPECIES: tyrosine--tRNA ligase [unclassified Bradyrhizobium]|uniref:tyrosine--tRNA ligase n=1 Tax=unclassified Bradyrhizobium TaxID=2631580 RepID=UPI00070F82C7|nr:MULTISPECIES: tyrosine--tRNA ligase [unclassified Bradyrhizobium]KQT15624.1 tyrosine--tRNA ligase [Bradyrhizobium sp. Leaf396]